MKLGVITHAIEQAGREHQEDRYFVGQFGSGRNKSFLLAIMDGHGGEAAAEYCRREMEKCFRESRGPNAVEKMRHLVKLLHGVTQGFWSIGCTLSLAWIRPSARSATVAVLGDSPIFFLDSTGALFMASVHNVVSNLFERQAAVARGGIFRNSYIQNEAKVGLKISRGLGDAEMGEIISHEPDIFTVRDPKLVIVATDGFVDTSKVDEMSRAITEMGQVLNRGNLSAQDLMKWGLERRRSDNTTVLLWDGR